MKIKTRSFCLIIISFIVVAFFSPVFGAGDGDGSVRNKVAMKAVDISAPLPEKGFFSPANGLVSGISPVSKGTSKYRAAFGDFSGDSDDLVWVIIKFAADAVATIPTGRLEELKETLMSMGGRVDLLWGNLVQAWLPASMIEAIADWLSQQ